MTELGPGQRDAQDWLVTPVDGFPTSAQADPDEGVLDLVLAQFRPQLVDLAAVLDAGDTANVDTWMRQLETNDPEGFDLIRIVCLARYLSSRPIWDVLGYNVRHPAPIRVGEADEYLDGLLDQPRRRGKVYRPTPEVGSVPGLPV